MIKRVLLALVCLSASVWGQTGTLTPYTTMWNGITRSYSVYIPQGLPANPAMVFVLHPTVFTLAPPRLFQLGPFERLADADKFIVVWPISIFNTRAKMWYWQAYFTDKSFPQVPDDVGFVGSLITGLSAQYTVDPAKVFVTGFSSGALMAHRLGIELASQIAAIATAEGQVDLAPPRTTNTLPQPTTPVSVLALQGDADTTIPYCGGPIRLWGEGWTAATVDQTTQFWRQANSCTDSVPQLCTNGQPSSGVDGLDATHCNGGVEVKAVREIGVGHSWPAGTEKTVWSFFSTHSRNGQ